MASRRQIRANRRNATRSTGPRTPAGLLRASRNARTHGLSIALDPAFLEPQFSRLVSLLLEEGLQTSSARALALKILDFERNAARQEEFFARRQQGVLVDVRAITEAAYLEDPMRGPLEAFAAGHTHPELSEADETIREGARFLVKLGRERLARQIQIASREAPESIRYYRRAGNQLIKALKKLS